MTDKVKFIFAMVVINLTLSAFLFIAWGLIPAIGYLVGVVLSVIYLHNKSKNTEE